MDTTKVVSIPDASSISGVSPQLATSNGQPEQCFTFTYVTGGYYEISSLSSGLALTLSGTSVVQSAWTGASTQLWAIRHAGNGVFNLVCQSGGLVLDVAGASTQEGATVGAWTYNGGANQAFTMTAFEPEHALATGTYSIGTASDASMRLDGASYVADDMAGIGLWTWNGSSYQTFQATYLGNGYYTIQDVGSGKYLDVWGGLTVAGTRVIQYQATGGANQQWAITSNGDGTYKMRSRSASMYLDLTGGSAAPKTALEIWTWNGGANQRFTFTAAKAPTHVLADGMYNITSSLDSTKSLDIAGGSLSNGTSLGLWTLNTGDNQKFTVTAVGDGCYVMEAVLSRKMLDIAGGLSASGTPIIQYAATGGVNQKWLIEDSGLVDGSGNPLYSIVSVYSGLTMTVVNGAAVNGGSVHAETFTGAGPQLFSFTATQMAPVMDDGVYVITSALDSDMSLDIAGASKDNGANVELYLFLNGANQRFLIKHVGDGYYTISPLHSSKYLDVEGASTTPGTNVSQYLYTGGDNQLWRIYPNEDGTWSFESKCGRLYLDLTGGSTANGTNIEVWTGNGSAAQNFDLTPISMGDMIIDISQWDTVTNWSKVQSSAAFVMLRTQDQWRLDRYGDAIDLCYDKYADACESYMIPYGCYAYVRATTAADAISEMDLYYYNATARYGHSPVFFVLDVEETTVTEAAVEAAVARLRALGAQKIGIYYGIPCADIVASSVDSVDFIWFARYGKNDGTVPGDEYKPTYGYDLWQYTSEGTVSGITGWVDLSLADPFGLNNRNVLWYIS